VAGYALLRVWRPAVSTRVPVARVVLIPLAFCIWAAATLFDGAWWAPRDMPLNPAPGVDNLPPEVWPWTAWLTIAVFAVIAVTPAVLHVVARRGAAWADLPAALRAVGATLLGRWIAVGWWWWSGWHFLAR
jgi:hypothetical protein